MPAPSNTDSALVHGKSAPCQIPIHAPAPIALRPVFSLTLPSSPSPTQEEILIGKMHGAVLAYCDSELDASRRTGAIMLHSVCRRQFSGLLEFFVAELETQQVEKAFHYLNLAFEWIKVLLKRNDSRFLLTLFRHVVTMVGAGLKDVAYRLLKYLMSLSAVILGKQHPVYVVADSLIGYPTEHLQYVAEAGLRTISAIITSKRAPFPELRVVHGSGQTISVHIAPPSSMDDFPGPRSKPGARGTGIEPQGQNKRDRNEVCYGCRSIPRTCYSLRISNSGYADVIEAIG
jgi:hypothetical protein